MRALPAALLLLPFAAAAQSQAPATAFEACAPIEDDVARLACYDAAARPPSPASPALFPADPQVARVAAKDDTLLAQRWELGEDQGLFVFRAYKPVYLLPAFWSEDPNEQPTSRSWAGRHE